MTHHRAIAVAAALLLAACGTRNPASLPNSAAPQAEPAESGAEPVPSATPEPAAPAPTTTVEPVETQRPLSEAETALSVAKQFANLLSARKYDQALQMWKAGGPSPRPSPADFAKRFAAFATVTARAAPPSHVEGAAGSLYADVPLTLAGTTTGGETYQRSGTITLKRVNDVPGATPEQLRWHIIDVKL